MTNLSISPIIALTPIQWVMIGVGGFFVLIIAGILMKFFSLWLQALLSNASVSFTSLIGMQLRKVSPNVVVINRITAKKAGIELSIWEGSLPAWAAKSPSPDGVARYPIRQPVIA